MQPTNILLSGLGGSLFPYLHEQLAPDFHPVYVDADASLTALYPELDFHPAPLVTAPEYRGFLRKLMAQKDIQFYAPLIDEEILLAHDIVAGTEVSLISPTKEFSELCLNKLSLMHRLAELNISHISSWSGEEVPDDAPYPLFVKPVSGRGSRGIFKLESADQYPAYLTLYDYAPEDLLVQEYVPGQEYTVGVLANRNNDVLCISTRKVLTKKGVTIRAVTENDPRIDAVVMAIQEKLEPRGPYNVQLYVTAEGEIKIFEINPRFSTTLVMSYAGGVDELALYRDNAEHYDGPIRRPRAGVKLRRNWKNNFI